jgi:hypothetical protein
MTGKPEVIRLDETGVRGTLTQTIVVINDFTNDSLVAKSLGSSATKIFFANWPHTLLFHSLPADPLQPFHHRPLQRNPMIRENMIRRHVRLSHARIA